MINDFARVAEELATLTGMMSQGGPNLGAPPAQARAEFEGLLASVPVSPDLKFEAAQAGGVPGLNARRSIQPGSPRWAHRRAGPRGPDR